MILSINTPRGKPIIVAQISQAANDQNKLSHQPIKRKYRPRTIQEYWLTATNFDRPLFASTTQTPGRDFNVKTWGTRSIIHSPTGNPIIVALNIQARTIHMPASSHPNTKNQITRNKNGTSLVVPFNFRLDTATVSAIEFLNKVFFAWF
jgi:hypothetical protein